MNVHTATTKAPHAFRDIYEQFAVDAAFLWVLRSIAVNQPHYTSSDIAALEIRIQANLDGLMTAPEESWEICREAMESAEPGEIFVAAVLAFRCLDVHKIQVAVKAGLASEAAFPGLVSALGWLPGNLCHSWIKKFLTSKDLDHKYLAIAACSVRREDPRDYLNIIMGRDDCCAHPKLYARSLRLIGELKRNDFFRETCAAMLAEDEEVRFWAHWSAVLLGHQDAIIGLKLYVFQPGPYQTKAVDLAFRVLPVQEARAWIGALAKDPSQVRTVIKATAALGDPHAINWLVGQMRLPHLTRLAGEAFTTITGIDLEANSLALDDLPDLDSDLPNDDPEDENIDMDEDENLPFPDVSKVAAVWQKYQKRFVVGQRYFMGKSITAEHLNRIFKEETQRRRGTAALDLALLQPSQFLFNIEAKGLTEE